MVSNGSLGAIARFLQRLAGEEKAENVVEYGLILTLVSLSVFASALQFGLSVEALWDYLLLSLAGATPFGP